MNKKFGAAVAAVFVAAGLGISPAAPSATAMAAPYCGIAWGSAADSAAHYSTGHITNVRTGRHACFDRLVIDLKGKVRGYDVRYVTAVYTEGQGKRVPLAGAADLQIVVMAPAYSFSGNPTYNPSNWAHAKNVAGYTTFRQVAFLGSFEGQTSFGLGVRARLPFRTFVLTGAGSTSMLVIDVAHRW
ncbi:AMIN-like domain-containing (lipo)protein [Paeniglutamicibacter kerguelensis]|uniref:AMIN-like domain-containing protein n=1 Tax=Paeniglutamicibacter kerguelensis TaxID=254788 RepID=A0ABS4XFV5_9MICC|nr:hypothetical protein [Paeniglutamicibacter kerguelensis]MBP2387349.1 hypothetical protein [Paeniglutamicibacter kerguelensis]